MAEIKKSWEAECQGEIDYQFLYGQVKKNGALLSSGIDFYEDGSITAGFRTVGKFEIMEKETSHVTESTL